MTERGETLVVYRSGIDVEPLHRFLLDGREGSGPYATWCSASAETISAVVSPRVEIRVLLDRLVMIGAPPHDDLVEAAFERLGSSLDEWSDQERNRNEVDEQLRLGASMVRPIDAVLDWGCGTGIARDQNVIVAEIVGVDVSETMRRIARSNGMTVVDPNDAKTLQRKSFDLCIACYVMHLDVPSSHLQHIAASLRDQGVLVANFHKGAGYESVRTLALRCGFQEVAYAQTDEDGHIRAAFRVQR